MFESFELKETNFSVRFKFLISMPVSRGPLFPVASKGTTRLYAAVYFRGIG